jgi:hypothetical protein
MIYILYVIPCSGKSCFVNIIIIIRRTVGVRKTLLPCGAFYHFLCFLRVFCQSRNNRNLAGRIKYKWYNGSLLITLFILWRLYYEIH